MSTTARAMRIASTVSAVATLLVLTGCVTVVPAPEPGFDPKTAAAFEQQWMDNTWRRTELPDELRPANPVVHEIELDDWGQEIVDCMSDAGFEGYAGSQGGYSRTNTEPLDLDETLALYLCEASRQVSPVTAGVLNSAQIDYWYEYYRLELVPCLQGAGLEVEESPSRSEFEKNGGYWNPYLSLDPNVRVHAIVDGRMLVACPPNAPGLHKPWGFD